MKVKNQTQKFDSMVCIELTNVGNNTEFVTNLWSELNNKWGDKVNIPAFDVGIEDCGPVIEYDSSRIGIDKLVADLRVILPKYKEGALVGLIHF
jgi:hypothetical protein